MQAKRPMAEHVQVQLAMAAVQCKAAAAAMQCIAAAAAAPSEILAPRVLLDAIFSLELRGSCAEIAALIGNVAALRRLLGSER